MANLPISLLPWIVFSWVSFGSLVNTHFSSGQDPTMTLSGDIAEQIDKLELTSEQIDRINEIEDRYSELIEQSQTEIQQQEREFTAMATGNASASEIEEKYQELQKTNLEAAQIYFDKFVALREELTPKQRLQLASSN
jgi:Spy/CpxP family protein refolding chaperone